MTASSTKQFGVLKSNNPSNPNAEINIRKEPVIPANSSSNVIANGKPGDRVEILDSNRPANDSRTWYKISCLPQTSIQGWVREDVITLSPPTEEPQAAKIWQLTVTTNTIFKSRPVDSAQLPDAEKVAIPASTILAISAYRQESSHYICTLAYGQKIKGRNTWAVFQDHAQIS
ncbi:MAG: SH3 domain-containing protein [Nostocaceae cyanobacterium]|nr:SH3 domain-containing protein [Nostocaceae cyanobacterium]